MIKDMRNKTRKIMKTILAISTDATAMPVNPKTPAMIAMIRNVNTQLNMAVLLNRRVLLL